MRSAMILGTLGDRSECVSVRSAVAHPKKAIRITVVETRDLELNRRAAFSRRSVRCCSSSGSSSAETVGAAVVTTPKSAFAKSRLRVSGTLERGIRIPQQSDAPFELPKKMRRATAEEETHCGEGIEAGLWIGRTRC